MGGTRTGDGGCDGSQPQVQLHGRRRIANTPHVLRLLLLLLLLLPLLLLRVSAHARNHQLGQPEAGSRSRGASTPRLGSLPLPLPRVLTLVQQLLCVAWGGFKVTTGCSGLLTVAADTGGGHHTFQCDRVVRHDGTKARLFAVVRLQPHFVQRDAVWQVLQRRSVLVTVDDEGGGKPPFLPAVGTKDATLEPPTHVGRVDPYEVTGEQLEFRVIRGVIVKHHQRVSATNDDTPTQVVGLTRVRATLHRERIMSEEHAPPSVVCAQQGEERTGGAHPRHTPHVRMIHFVWSRGGGLGTRFVITHHSSHLPHFLGVLQRLHRLWCHTQSARTPTQQQETRVR